ncbi:HAMP domain-containing sensor histidine kinase [Sporomusa sp.]|uniref:HAMP domain-containing sensor histidine kinase n=1 Tax=Sporomusa sp. TaxID=2078658 RepID=UPI002BF3C976|nr:HAMP domain-containing sensor histidine kinase [Sporomusa sp.]HWR45917.1 HAMP domain-containing sensor histidine kinase [Sporomusa sp.]
MVSRAIEPGKRIKISSYCEGAEIVLAVYDEGKGISEEILENLGKPFLTTKENGTGLGLAICYSIASRHNAKIDVKSNSEGTTFFVRFKTLENIPKPAPAAG